MARCWLIMAVVVLMAGACGKDPGGEASEVPEVPEWDRSKNTTVHFVSRLDAAGLLSGDTDYKVVADFVQGKQHTITELDRCDVSLSGDQRNAPVSIARQTKQVLVYAPNVVNQTAVEGSAVLINHSVTAQDMQQVATDCFFKSAETRVNSTTGMGFGTVCFSTDAQVKEADAILQAAVGKNRVMVGTVQRTLYESLRSQVLKYSGARIDKIEPTGTPGQYVIFVLTSKSWIFREATQATVQGAVKAYTITIQYL